MQNNTEGPLSLTRKISNNKKTHRSFQAMLVSDSTNRKYRRKKIEIAQETVTDAEGFNIIKYSTHFLLESRISLNPEAIAYFFFLDGCAKNLLLYIISNELNVSTGQFPLNKQVRDRFSDYCLRIGGKEYSLEAVKKAVKKLVDSNCMICNGRGSYLLNPVLAGGDGADHRRQLIRIYTSHLRNKGKTIDESLFPKYKVD